MKSNRALFHMCASPNAPAGDDFGVNLSSSCAINTVSCSSDPLTGVAMNLFSPFSPMDAQNQENITSNTTTPRRKLSLEMDENAQSPLTLEQDVGYGGSLGSSSASSLVEGIEAANISRTPLGEIKLSALNTANVSGCQRKTLLARRLMKRENSKDNISGKGSPVDEGEFKFCHPLPLLHHRPTSLPTRPLSPLTQQLSSPSSLESKHPMRSFQNGACKNLMKQINSPLERMSLMSSFSSSVTPRRSSSIASSTYTDACSDGYFSEVFDGEEVEDVDSSTPLSDTLTTLINAPLANSQSLSTISGNSKPTFHIGEFKESQVDPKAPPPRAPGFLRSDSWSPSFLSSKAVMEEEHSLQKRGTLKRASPCNEIAMMHRTKRRPPLPFTDISSNSQDSLPTTQHSTKQLKGTPLLRSQSCCVPHNEPFPSPTSPGTDDPNKIGDFTMPYALPLVAGTVHDLKCISPETVSDLLAGRHSSVVETFTIIDCRFPYEYEGGHILSAVNIWEKDQLTKYFFDNPRHPTDQHRKIYIFHCEFSSKRGPQMSRFLRETDRRKNGMDFPKLYYPELYLMEGGYRAFFKDHKQLCEPQGYRQMIDENHKDELKHCKLRSKSWNGECHPRRRPPQLRCRKSAFISNRNKDSNSASNDSDLSRTNSSPGSCQGCHY